MSPKKSDNSLKLCAVCGDKAIAKNFDVWSCKSCKPFFRRNAHLLQRLKCFRGGNCRIDIKTRKKCRKCRLIKCFALGMRIDWILSDEERVHRNNMIKMKRFDRTETMSKTSEDQILNYSENVFHETSSSVDNEEVVDTESNQQDICDLEEFIQINEIVQNSVDQYKDLVNQVVPRSAFDYTANYNELEDYKLTELFQLMRNLEFNTKGMHIDPKGIKELVQHGGIFYENEAIKLIKTFKMMNGFETINENDRLALVKFSAIEILILRTVFLYDSKELAWRLPIGDFISIYRMVEFKLSPDGYTLYKNNWNSILKECDSDSVIVDLLTAIALFNPNRPHIIDRNAIDVQQRVYMHLLKRYLLFKCRTMSESEDRFWRLLNILIFSQTIGQLERRYLYEPNPDVCGPLCLELFDINYHRSIELCIT